MLLLCLLRKRLAENKPDGERRERNALFAPNSVVVDHSPNLCAASADWRAPVHLAVDSSAGASLPRSRRLLSALAIMKGRIFLLFAWLLSQVGAQIVVEENLPGYEVVQVLSDLFRVTDFVVTPDNRLITVAKEGAVEIYDATTYQKLSTAIDLSDSVCTEQENGIQSVTLHPDFASNGYLYIFHVRASSDGACVYPPEGSGNPVERGPTARLSRFTLPTGANTIDPDSEFVLLDFGPCAKKHNGGGVQFGPDGLLYVGTGDAGHKRANKMSFLTNTLHGKILRLTDTGGIPPDNPYADDPNSEPCGMSQEFFPSEDKVCQEIFSFGMRNPFNLAMDPFSSAESIRFFINDVGQSSYEEISQGGTGYELLNYGWPEREGPCFDQGERCDIDDAFVDPLHWWPNSEGTSIAATAGVVVPPGTWANFEGDYIYAGYGDSRIFHMKPGNPNACRGPQCSTQISEYSAVPIVEGVDEDEARLLRIHFEDYQGSDTLYFLTHSKTGGLYVLSPLVGTNRRPFANITQFVESDGSQLTVHVNASASSDPDGDGLSYLWDFGDSNATSTGVVARHTYTTPGKYIVTLTVADTQGATATESVSVTLPQVSVFSTPPVLFPWRAESLEGEELLGGVLEFCSDGETTYGYRLPCDDKCLPGLAPIIRVQPGKRYQFTLRNVASAETRTNIHTHGLHLSGSGDADDVTRVVTGGSCLDYTWDISSDHPGGTYWYHSHYHGLSEEQVAGGAYGLLIVEDNTSTNNDIPAWASNELLLMISQVDGVFGGNGKPYDIFNIDANQWYRLRVSVVDVLGVPLELRFTNGCEVHQVASDGIWHSRVPGPVSNQYELTGASRADFAVRCAAMISTLRSAVVSTVNILYNDQPVAVVNVGPVEPNPFVMEEWTPARPVSLQNISSVSVPDENRLSLEIQRQTINDLEWDANIPLATIAYDQVHEWELSDSTEHPFHLHLYHMLVMTPGGCGAHKEGEFYDTIAGPPCTVRFKAADFGQRCVFHCHVMEHGDLGAMNWVDVQGEGMPINDIVSPEYNCSSPSPEVCSSSTPSPSSATTSSPSSATTSSPSSATTSSPIVALPSPTDPQSVLSPPTASPVSSDQQDQKSGTETVISGSTGRSVLVAFIFLTGLFWTMMMIKYYWGDQRQAQLQSGVRKPVHEKAEMARQENHRN